MNIYLDLFLTFFKLGATTFGGGYAMMSQIKESIVEKKEWLTNDELLEVFAISESTPGPVAINMATYIGFQKGKILGSILATLGVILPSFIIIFIISLFLNKFLENKYVAYAFVGIKCAVAFLILKAGLNLFKKMKKAPWQLCVFGIVLILMILLELFSKSFSSIYLIIIGGVIGIIILTIQDHIKRKRDEIQ
ncbi:MAG: chromate transporter [Roseburia sp.]|nr:chromate transporter [Anaeroplasma bactoclasticum]MCM1196447.1 chromate transporter [Roseburia sp.]MCM1556563.1 chromate transporter [Anaeroplasma bactoclasticum]